MPVYRESGQSILYDVVEALFNFQLRRDSFTSTPEEFSLLVETKSAGDDVYAALDWEEISR